MGRIKTRILKTKTKEIMDRHGSKLDNDFEKNKKVISEKAEIKSKKLRNIIAGYSTRLKKLGKY